MLSKEENKNLLEGVDYGKGESKSVTNFLTTECPKCNHKIEFRLAIKDIKNVEEYIEKLETDKQKLIEKLEKDIVNITKTMQDGKHCDDYSRCRLKAYRTKTKEILKILKGEKE